MRKLIFSLLFFSLIGANGQTLKKCAVRDLKDPKYGVKYSPYFAKKSEVFLKNGANTIFEEKLLRIPIVVHIIHNNSSGTIGGKENGNISDEQVFSQIKVLNEDYRRQFGTLGYNTSPVGSDMNIEFFLANFDPDGKPSSGINRIYSPKASFDVFKDNFNLSNLSYWDSNRYLNIWVTSLKDDFLGYAEFPTGEYDGLELDETDEKIDGVMIDHHAFGKKIGTANNGVYTDGRTLTHEIGHWLGGLIHTWGDDYCGDDFCNDTPPTESANLTTICVPKYSNCKGQKTLNMIENFMDYTVDSCMNIFTQDQKNRTRAILEISKRRKRLLTFAEFNLPQTEQLVVKVLENPSSTDNIQFQVLLNAFGDFDYQIFDNFGRKILSESYTDTPSRLIQISKNSLGKGIYHLKVKSGNEMIFKKLISL
ncbi:T9SS C-terminal target domain-containing protein [Lacihabitans sp. LS3-19]|uniref:M43 family zinc metalloprotease n=1 Tax=Lacihabitans sp. LS3-19 TaxID=2487335 RepID=UPI0020CC22ED|nr:M43 family zinc metalloprotease [Lacihabitans sp. LS3-19]MCP9769947.1 T9SS C-terminal target domain-containing protein [Lacihabitans sp. LS3-19]